MAPRKSTTSNPATDTNGDVSMISNATATSNATHAHPRPSRPSSSGGGGGGGGGTTSQGDGTGIDDLLLPRTLVQRLARGVLPPNTSIQRDAVLAISKSATVFISYLAHAANEQSTRKTLSPQDVLTALKEIELDHVMQLGVRSKDGKLAGRLERELEVYEEALFLKRKGAKDRKTNRARESAGGGSGGGSGGGGVAEEGEDRGEPSTKKPRRMADANADDETEDAEDQDLLDSQLNGDESRGASDRAKGKRKGQVAAVAPSSSSTTKPATGAQNGKARAADETESEQDEEGDDEEENDDAEDEEENDDDDDDEGVDDDDDDDDEDDDENDDDENDRDDTEAELEGRRVGSNSRRRNGRAGAGGGRLQPNGRAEIGGSDDESD